MDVQCRRTQSPHLDDGHGGLGALRVAALQLVRLVEDDDAEGALQQLGRAPRHHLVTRDRHLRFSVSLSHLCRPRMQCRGPDPHRKAVIECFGKLTKESASVLSDSRK